MEAHVIAEALVAAALYNTPSNPRIDLIDGPRREWDFKCGQEPIMQTKKVSAPRGT